MLCSLFRRRLTAVHLSAAGQPVRAPLYCRHSQGGRSRAVLGSAGLPQDYLYAFVAVGGHLPHHHTVLCGEANLPQAPHEITCLLTEPCVPNQALQLSLFRARHRDVRNLRACLPIAARAEAEWTPSLPHLWERPHVCRLD